jgi:hypothetical protein
MKTPRKQVQNTLDVQENLENKHETNHNKNMRISRGKRTKTLKNMRFSREKQGFCKMLHYPPPPPLG